MTTRSDDIDMSLVKNKAHACGALSTIDHVGDDVPPEAFWTALNESSFNGAYPKLVIDWVRKGARILAAIGAEIDRQEVRK